MSVRNKNKEKVVNLPVPVKQPTNPAVRLTRPKNESLAELYDILTYCRPADSSEELAMIERFIIPTGATSDTFGNYILRIGDSPIMWSCHTDTVHTFGGTQSLYKAPNGHWLCGYMQDQDGEQTPRLANCLGADCGTGVWLMLQMIKANVPGLYIFHREEECGAHGSSYIAKMHNDEKYSHKGILDGIKYAIAFDRKGTTSVITSQLSSQCCSKEFAESLILELSTPYERGEISGNLYTRSLDYVKDAGGTFTDTANYTHIIPECTNISVGYFSQHTSSEAQDIVHLQRLLTVLLQLDYTKLVCSRAPVPRYQRYSSGYGFDDGDDWMYSGRYANYGKSVSYAGTGRVDSGLTSLESDLNELAKGRVEGISDEVRWIYHLIKDNPAACASIFQEYGYDYDTLASEIRRHGGTVHDF